MKLLLTVLLVSLLFVGCDINSSTSSLVEELKEGKNKWEKAGLTNYEYRYQALCFCAFTDDMIVVVRNDTVAQVLDIETREPYLVQQGDEEQPIIELFPSLFNTISVFYDRWIVEVPIAHAAKFEWDKSTGMPISMYIDRAEDIADDEITYNFSGLKID